MLGLAPQVAEFDGLRRYVVGLAYQRGDGGASLDTHGVLGRGEDARVGLALRRRLTSLEPVAVQAVDSDGVEGFEVAFAHSGEGEAVQPRVVGDEAHHALARLFGDASLGHAEEADVEVIQSLALGPPHLPGGAVGLGQFTLLVHGHAGEAVVGRVTQDDEDGRVLLDAFGAFPLLLQFGEGQRLLHRGFPAGERVGQEDAGAFVAVIGQGGVQFLHGEADLQVGDHEGGRHDLEAEDALGSGLLYLRSGERSESLVLQVGGDAAQRLSQVRAGDAAGVEDVHVLAGQPVGDAKASFRALSTRATM